MHALPRSLTFSDEVALVFVDAPGHRRDYTFRELSDQFQNYAAVLHALGVIQGDRVLLCTSNTAKCAFIVLALMQLGASAVPCPETWNEDEILERARSESVRFVITNRSRRPTIERAKPHFAGGTGYILVGETCEGWARIDTLVESAKPHRELTSARGTAEDDDARTLEQPVLGIVPPDRVWSTLPLGAEPWSSLVRAPWWSGASSVVHEGVFEPRERLELVHELDVTVLCQPAHEYRAQLELMNLSDLRLPRLRKCIAIGEPLEPHAAALWRERTGLPIENITDVRSPQKS